MGSSSTKSTWRGILKLAMRPRQARDELLGGDRGVGFSDDEGHRHLGEARVGIADDGDLEQRRMAEEVALDLHRVDVLAAHLEHVLVAADEAHVAVGTEEAMSPVWNQPSASRARAVSSGFL